MSASTSNTESLLLRRLAQVHQTTVAEAIGSSTTHISHFASGERGLRIHQLGPALEALGLKLVDVNEQTVDPKYLESLRNLAMRGI